MPVIRGCFFLTGGFLCLSDRHEDSYRQQIPEADGGYGDITLEFYLIHGLYVELFSYSFDGKAEPLYYMKNSLVFLIIVFALALPSALLLKYVRRKLLVIK